MLNVIEMSSFWYKKIFYQSANSPVIKMTIFWFEKQFIIEL